MAWGSIGTASTVAYATANQASMVHTLGANGIAVGNVAVMAFTQWNATTVQAVDAGVVTTVNDAAGNTWLKVKEIQNVSGTPAAQAGCVCSLWYTRATAALSSGTGTITATLLPGSSASFDAGASIGWIFSVGAPVSVLDSTTSVVSGSSSPGSLDINTVTTGPYLRFRGIATHSTLTGFSGTAGWTEAGQVRASATLAENARAEFIITASSTAASAPTFGNAATGIHASVYVVFAETPSGATVGDAQGDATASGVLSAAGDFAGTAQGDAAASATGISAAVAAGAAQGDAVASGVSSATALSPGLAQGDAAADAVGVATKLAEGIAAGDAAAVAAGEALSVAVGSADGDATAAAFSEATALSDGLATGDAVASAEGTSGLVLTSGDGAATGDAAASAEGASGFAAVGAVTGDADAAAVGNGDFPAVGLASGDAVASAEGFTLSAGQGVGTAEGDATADAVSASLAEALGAAEGDAEADAGGALDAPADGLAQGDANASGIGVGAFPAVGTAIGDSEASAIAEGSIGFASGDSVAAAQSAIEIGRAGLAVGDSFADARSGGGVMTGFVEGDAIAAAASSFIVSGIHQGVITHSSARVSSKRVKSVIKDTGTEIARVS